MLARYGDTPDGKYGLIETAVDSATLDKAAADGSLKVSGRTLGEVSVGTAGLAGALKAARPCLDDLAVKWGAPRTWAVDPNPIANPLGLFKADDFPSALIDARRQGLARGLLGINAQGKVTSCRPIAVEGDPAFGEVTCAVLRKRARFAPARDADGKAVESFYLSPPVRWTLSG